MTERKRRRASKRVLGRKFDISKLSRSDAELELRTLRFVLSRPGFSGAFPRLAITYRAEAAQIEAMLNQPPPVAATQETEKMNRNQRRLAASADTPSISAPHPDWHLVACKRFTSGGKIYDAGCAATIEALGVNYQSLIAGGYCRWMPPTVKARSTPRDVPAPAPTPENPKVEIVADPDPVVSWKKSLAAMAEKYAGDWGRAKNALETDRAGAELFKLATRVLAEKNAREQRTAGRRVAAL